MIQQQISPVSIAIDCLNSFKYLASEDVSTAVESGTPQVRQLCSRMIQDHLSMQEEWFRLMNSKGWYPVTYAKQDKVAQAISEIQNITSHTAGMQTQAFTQQQQAQAFTQQQNPSTQFYR